MTIRNNKQAPTTIAQLVESSGNELARNVELDNTVNVHEQHDSDAPSRTTYNNKVKLLDRLIVANMLVPGSKLSREIQDDYRRIKRPLVSNACGRDKQMVDRGNLILVTSSVPGEGKSYTSVNLALSISQEMDNTVLLVDCDVAKQGASRILGLENVSGLVDVLESDDLVSAMYCSRQIFLIFVLYLQVSSMSTLPSYWLASVCPPWWMRLPVDIVIV